MTVIEQWSERTEVKQKEMMKNKSQTQRNWILGRHIKRRRTEEEITGKEIFPEEVVEQILSRVSSVKSVLRFKCVSKAWYKLLSSKAFTFMHLNTSRRDSDSLVIAGLVTSFKSQTAKISAVTVPTTMTASSAAIATKVNHQLPKKMLRGDYEYSNGPCNGIFCLYNPDEILLWNPAINDLKVVPPTNEPCRVPTEPIEAFSAELGFDPKTNDFKILHVWYDIFHCQHQLQLYTLGTDSWKNLDASTFNTYKLHFSSPRFTTNSQIGWVLFDFDLPVPSRQYKLCLFDVSCETFDMTPPIPTEEGSILSRETRVFPFRGSIAVVLCLLPEFFGCFEIWALNDLTCTTTSAQSTSWTKLWTISQLQHPFQQPLGLWGSFYLTLKRSVTLKRWDLMLYDLVNQEAMDLNQDVVDLVAAVCKSTMHTLAVYRESLIYVSDNKRAAC